MPRVAALVVAALAGLTLAAARRRARRAAPRAAAPTSRMALIAQPFTVAADQPWTATFAVSGDLGPPTPSHHRHR